MRVQGINAVFHDPAAVVADGRVMAVAEEEGWARPGARRLFVA